MNVKQEQLKPSEKKPYEKPRIVFRETVEAMAGVCTSGVIGAKTNIIGTCSAIFS